MRWPCQATQPGSQLYNFLSIKLENSAAFGKRLLANVLTMEVFDKSVALERHCVQQQW